MANILSFLLSHKKLIAGLVASIGLLVSVSQVYDWVYTKGVNDTIVKIQSEQLLLDGARRLETESRIKESLSLQKEFYENRIESLKKEKEVEAQVKEVIRYVNKEIIVPSDCTDFSNDIIGVLKQANDIVIRSAADRSTKAKDNE
jgi:hypothetical protein